MLSFLKISIFFNFIFVIMILSNDWFSRQYFDKIEISFYLRTSWISTYLSIKAFISCYLKYPGSLDYISMSNTTGTTIGVGNDYPSRVPQFILCFSEVR